VNIRLKMKWFLSLIFALGTSTFSHGALKEIVLGNPKAPLVMVTYTSLTCSHCAHFQSQILPYLKTKYIDSGKVQVIIRDYPLDEAALKATMVARSFPDRYEEIASKLYRAQDKWVGSKNLEGALVQVTGLPLDQIKQATTNQILMKEIIEENVSAQNQYKISGTPTFIVGGKMITDAGSLQDFDKVLASPETPSVISINNG
jgi:protein-disulfide isomerase